MPKNNKIIIATIISITIIGIIFFAIFNKTKVSQDGEIKNSEFVPDCTDELIAQGLQCAITGKQQKNNEIIKLEKGKYISQNFVDSFKTCNSYTEKYIDPITEEIITRKIEKAEGDKCHYIETLLEGQMHDCYYPIEIGDRVAEHYELIKNAKRVSVSYSAFDVETNSPTIKESIDGKYYDSPLTDSKLNSKCIIKKNTIN